MKQDRRVLGGRCLDEFCKHHKCVPLDLKRLARRKERLKAVRARARVLGERTRNARVPKNEEQRMMDVRAERQALEIRALVHLHLADENGRGLAIPEVGIECSNPKEKFNLVKARYPSATKDSLRNLAVAVLEKLAKWSKDNAPVPPPQIPLAMAGAKPLTAAAGAKSTKPSAARATRTGSQVSQPVVVQSSNEDGVTNPVSAGATSPVAQQAQQERTNDAMVGESLRCRLAGTRKA